MSEQTRNNVGSRKLRTIEAFKATPSLHPLVVGHMCKQDKSHYTFSKRYFALYDGGLLIYYTHQRAYEEDVKKHEGIPVHSTLVKLDGLHLTRPKHSIKHCFTLHAPEKSNHRDEFLLVCRCKKDMRIWVEELQSQNRELAQGGRVHKTPDYIKKLRLEASLSLSTQVSVEEMDFGWLKRSSYHPGDIALKLHADSNSSTPSSEPQEQQS